MIEFITAQVIRQNEAENNVPFTKPVPALNTTVRGTFWRVPVQSGNGHFLRFDYVDGSLAKPTVDSVKVLRLRDNGGQQYYWILLQDTGSASDWTTRANLTDASTLTAMPTVTMPVLLSEQKGCLGADNNYTYQFIGAPLAAGQQFNFFGSYNGIALTTPPQSGFADVASFVTWANTNWTAAGTWSNPSGNVLQLVSTVAKSAGVSISRGLNFDSGNIPTLTTGNHYILTIVADGVTTVITGVINGTGTQLIAQTQADAVAGAYGTYSQVTGPKIRLFSPSVQAATLTITQSA